MKIFYHFCMIFSFSSLFADTLLDSLLEDITEISTKTKLNIDYQPSVVSVMHANKLKKIGIRNLHEAIGLLPGIETSILHTGWKQVIIRGAYNPDTFIFDKYKLSIDGVDVGSDLYSTSYYYLDFPIELIERIEVLRGSASTIYGPGAFSGAINVITKSSQNSNQDILFASTGSYEYYKGGFIKHVKLGDWHLALDSYYQANNKTLDASASFVSAKELNYARSDYKSLENFQDYAVAFSLRNDALELIARYKSEITDNFYGIEETLEGAHGGYQKNKSSIIELRYNTALNKDIGFESKLGLNHYAFEFFAIPYNVFSGTGKTFQIHPSYEQLSSYIDLSLHAKDFQGHDLLFGVNIQKINTLKNEHGTTLRSPVYTGPAVFSDTLEYLSGLYGFIEGNNNQLVQSIYFQDIYALTDMLDISLNLRYDEYSLFKEMYSYRLGGVYRLSDAHILKAIYGKSYRVPSYVEAFQAVQSGLKKGNPNLKPESIDTFELAYTYKNRQLTSRSNIFYSLMKDVIDIVHNEPSTFVGDYANHKKRTARGIESEFNYIFANNIELMLNLSYVRTQFFSPDYYNPVEYQSPEISEVLAKGYLLYPLGKKLSINTSWYYNGPKKGYDRENAGNAREIDASFVVDETLAYVINPYSMVTLSVKNLFDTELKYPSYQQTNNDITREGRNWLLTYEQEF